MAAGPTGHLQEPDHHQDAMAGLSAPPERLETESNNGKPTAKNEG